MQLPSCRLKALWAVLATLTPDKSTYVCGCARGRAGAVDSLLCGQTQQRDGTFRSDGDGPA